MSLTRDQEAYLPLRNRASAIHFFVAQLLSIAVMTYTNVRHLRPMNSMLSGNYYLPITQNLYKWFKYSLPLCRRTGRYTRYSHPADKCCWFHWTVKTGRLTHLILIPWIIHSVVLFSSWRIVRSSTTSTIWNKSWTVAVTWSANDATGCQYSTVH